MAGAPQEQESAETAALSQRRDLVARLFAEHNRALISFLTARLHCEQEAFDVAQEAYVRMLQLDQPVSFHKAYLFRIAQNLITDRARQRVVRDRFTEDDVVNFRLLQVEPEPDRNVLAQLELDEVQKRLAELPAKCRDAFVHHIFMDRSTQDIAAAMNLSERMVRMYIVRAMAHCRGLLESGEAQA